MTDGNGPQATRVANKFSPKEFREELLQVQEDALDELRGQITVLRGQVDRQSTLIEILQRRETERSEADSFMMSQLHDVHAALDALIHTFDTPSQVEKRAILEKGITAVNKMNVRFGSPFPNIPLG